MPNASRYGPFQAMLAAYARSKGVTGPSFRAHLAERAILVSDTLVERWLNGRELLPVDVAVLLVEHAGGWLAVLSQALLVQLAPVPPSPAAPAVTLRRAA